MSTPTDQPTTHLPAAHPPAAASALRSRRRRRWGLGVTAVVGGVLLVGTAVTVLDLTTATTTTRTTEVPDALRSLRVDTAVGDVRVTVDPAATTTTVTSTTRSGFSRAEAGSEVVDGQLRLTGRCDRWLWSSTCSTAFAVTVPAGLDLGLDTGTGEQVLAGAFGDVRTSSGTGDVRWTGARGGAFTADVGTGDLVVRGEVATLGVDGGTGSVLVDLDAAPRGLDVSTGTGDVTVGVPDDGTAYAVTAEAGTGQSVVRVPVDTADGVPLRAEAGTGDVTVTTR